MGRVKSVEEILYLTPPSAVISGDPNQHRCRRHKIWLHEAGRLQIQPAQIHGQYGCREL